MKVVCTKAFPTNKCTNSSRRVPIPQIGDFDVVIKTRQYQKRKVYILERFPSDVGYESEYFSKLSNIDELQLTNSIKEVVL